MPQLLPLPPAVERLEGDGSWAVVHTDADWSTRFAWGRPHSLSELSFATISWEVPGGTPPGTYRLRHFGDCKPWFRRWCGAGMPAKFEGQAGAAAGCVALGQCLGPDKRPSIGANPPPCPCTPTSHLQREAV